jgi:UDP-glucose 4-epimerase
VSPSKGVVTGGSGFLGSHVADVLAEAGHEITVVDVAPTERHRFMKADLLDREALAGAFRGAEFVCHLAAVGDVYLAASKPWLAAETNVTGSANVCEAALAAGVPTVICASTWEVYGPPQRQPIDEDHPTAPDHPYNITKLAGERLALAYGHLRKDLRVSALRLGTAYGSRMRPNSVFSLFIDRALRGEPITIQGTGEQGRQFTHARDIGDAFALAVTTAANGSVYNTVGDEYVTIKQLAGFVTARIPTAVVHTEARLADVPPARVSNDRIKRDLGWSPGTKFADGLAELIDAAPKARPGD